MLRITSFRRRSSLAAIAILAIAVPLVTYGTLRGRSTGNSAVTTSLEVELITLRPAGFEPAEIIRPSGPFVIFIDDRSSKENSSIVLQSLKGERLRTAGLNRKKSEWNELVDLPPGNYLLHDASNAQLSCKLTILP